MAHREHKKVKPLKLIEKILFITLGAAFMAAGIELFLVPNKIIDGGIVGISIMLAELTPLNLGLYILILNIPFFFLGYKQIGKSFALSTVYGISILSIFTSLLHHIEPVTNDPLLATVFGGMVLGAGVGLVIRKGGCLDGTEVMAILISQKLPLSVGQIVMIFNVFILGSAGFVFGWDKAMYSLLAYYIAFKMIDIVMEGLDQSKSVWIISDKYEEIANSISNRLGRGVTYLNGEGAYTGEEKKVIFVVISRLEEAKLKEIVSEADSEAFFALGPIHDIKGGNFKKKSIH